MPAAVRHRGRPWLIPEASRGQSGSPPDVPPDVRWHDMDMDSTPAARRVGRRIEFSRSSSDRMLLGVCGGVAQRYGVDAYVVRIAVLLLTLTGGLGVVLYLVGWAISAPPDDDGSAATTLEPGVVVGALPGRRRGDGRVADDRPQHRRVAGRRDHGAGRRGRLRVGAALVPRARPASRRGSAGAGAAWSGDPAAVIGRRRPGVGGSGCAGRAVACTCRNYPPRSLPWRWRWPVPQS